MGYDCLDFSDFCILAGCDLQTLHFVRKMVSHFVENFGDALLRDFRQYMLSHSEEVDKRYYQGHLNMDTMNKIGQATYRANFSEDALLQDKDKEKGKDKRLSRLPAVNIEQKERDFRGRLKLTEAKLLNYRRIFLPRGE